MTSSDSGCLSSTETTRYRYDPKRRWLSGIETKNRRGQSYQDITYALDAVGNVKTYKNEGGGFTTKQEYRYDDLYQLVEVTGNSRGSGELGLSYYESSYRQEYRFNGIGNMTVKVNEEWHPGAKAPGDQLNYTLDYDYIQGTHKASRIGNRYYGYDRNGNVTAEQDGTPVTAGTGNSNATVREEGGGVYSTDYGFALRNKQQGTTTTGGINRREYEWNERNLLKRSADGQWDVQYRYGADGQRAIKYSASGALREETLYFNKMFQITKVGSVPSTESKHIYVGEVRIATKQKREGNVNLEQEGRQQYYYHGDHLGSAQLVTDWKGDLYEHLEYAPYGELWIDRAAMDVGQNATPFRFTGKELDKETGLYYYGARYLDPKTSRWISGDPALGEYVPQAPVNDEARKYNKNLPGMGGIFNTVNLHVYHYAGNNPIKLVDPDGRQNEGALTKFIIKWFTGEKLFNEHLNDPFYDGFAGFSDKILHAAVEFPAIVIGQGADIVGLIAIGSGNVPLAAAMSGVSMAADFALLGSYLVKATNSGAESDWNQVKKQAAVMGIKTLVSWSVNKGIAEVRVTQSAKNGGYYQKGHRGRLSNTAGLKKMLFQDLSPLMGAKNAEILTGQIINSIKKNSENAGQSSASGTTPSLGNNGYY